MRFQQSHDSLLAPRAFGLGVCAPLWFDPVRISVSVLKSQSSESVAFNLREIAKDIIWLTA
jgi:hypothetical protein